MQETKKQILESLSEVVKELRGEKSQFKFCAENNISISIISTIERGIKDPQLTTIFKIAEAFNIPPEELISLISKKLPKNFSIIDK